MEITPFPQKNARLPSENRVALDTRLQKLTTSQYVTSEHPRFSEFYDDTYERVTVIPKPGETNPSVSSQFETDCTRMEDLSLTVNFSDQKKNAPQDVLPALEKTVKKISPKDKDALLRRLTDLCSQTPYNPLLHLIQMHTLTVMDEDGITFPSETIKRRCELIYSPPVILANLSIESEQLKIMPFDATDPTKRNCQAKAKVTVTIPIDEPDNCSVGTLYLEVNAPPSESSRNSDFEVEE